MRKLAKFAAVMLLLASVAAGQDPPKKIDFAHDVLPILKARCAACHTRGTYKGDFSLDTRASLLKSKAVVPGNSGKSELFRRVTAREADVRMPQKGKPLSPQEIALVKRWIDEGLPWQEGFSFAKPDYRPRLAPRRPKLPPATGGRTHPIDRIVFAYYRQHQIEPPPPAGDAEFLRRVSLDLVGLLPEPKQREAFLADQRPDKRDRLVESLLADQRGYAEHWLTFWNDLLRNDYQGTGYIDGGRKQITGWLYQALLTNKPYDRFVRELIHPQPESEGFIRGIKWRGRVNASQVVEIQFAQNISQVFLGVNMKCASCHDSFIDDWKLTDAYGLAAIVANRPLEIHRCDKPTGETAAAKFLFPQLGRLDASQPREKRLARLAELLTHPENGRFTRTIVNRLWERLMGRGIVHPVDVMSNEPWSEDLIDYLAVHLADKGYDLKQALRLIVTSQTYQSQCQALASEPEGEFVFRGPTAKRMTAEQFLDAVWRITETAPKKPAANFGNRGEQPVRAALVTADPLMRSLGRPNREQVVTTRPAELTTLQALDLSNGEILAGTLARGAKNLRRRHPQASGRELAVLLYQTALTRDPNPKELQVAEEIVAAPVTDQGLADLLWGIFMLPEFQLIR